MKSRSLGYLAAALGIVLTAVGLWLAKTFPEAAGAMAALPYVLIGLGCGAFGHGVGALANAAVFRKHPDIAREKAIEEKDERNVAILNRAKAKALDMMFYVFGALMVSLALMGADTASYCCWSPPTCSWPGAWCTICASIRRRCERPRGKESASRAAVCILWYGFFPHDMINYEHLNKGGSPHA